MPRPCPRFFPLFLLCALIFALAGCGTHYSTSNPAANETVSSSSSSSTSSSSLVQSQVTIYPGSASVPVSGKVQFTAFAASQPTSTFTWSVTGGGSITSAGLYTAPASPASVTVTATASGNSGLTGTAPLNISSAQGVLVSPSAIALTAGATQSFSALLNGNAAAATWEVNGTPGGDGLHGIIDSSGNYSAPFTPPPGGTTTITAIIGSGSSTVSGTATVAVVFSNSSFNGSYAFSYRGNNSSGFTAAAGSFIAQGSSGQIFGGVEDVMVFGNSSAAHTLFTGTFSVNPDGTGSATLSDSTIWQFSLVSSPVGGAAPQALLIRFDSSGTASGAINAQNQALLTASAFSGNYVFGLYGVDSSGATLAIAGRFFSDGFGTIPPGSAVQDINDNGRSTLNPTSTSSTSTTTTTVTTTTSGNADTTLHGSFLMDGTAPNSGRGTITFASTNTTVFTSGLTLQLAFYIVDNTHLKVVEIDNAAALAGDFYLAQTPNLPEDGAFNATFALPKGNYAFTLMGRSSSGAYAAGGVLNSNGGGTTPGATSGSVTGVMDVNDGIGNIRLNSSLTGSSFSVDPNYGRITLPLSVNNVIANVAGYTAAYNTATGPVEFLVLIELDTSTTALGMAMPQASTSELQGAYALNLAGASGAKNGAVEQDAIGEISTLGTSSFNGSLYINNFALNTTAPHVALNNNTLVLTPDSNGRGTAIIASSAASYTLAYYIVGNNNALLLEVDGSRVTTGALDSQY